MFWRLGAITVMVGVLVACGGVKQEDWNEASAEASCKYSKRCSTANFYYNFEDVDACVSNTVTMLNELDDYYTDCLFDDDAAKKCLKALDASCKSTGQNYDDVRAPCYEVWDCAQDFTPADDTAKPL